MLAGALILLLKILKIFAGDTDIVALSDSVAEHSDLWTSAEWEAGLQGLLDSPQHPLSAQSVPYDWKSACDHSVPQGWKSGG